MSSDAAAPFERTLKVKQAADTAMFQRCMRDGLFHQFKNHRAFFKPCNGQADAVNRNAVADTAVLQNFFNADTQNEKVFFALNLLDTPGFFHNSAKHTPRLSYHRFLNLLCEMLNF